MKGTGMLFWTFVVIGLTLLMFTIYIRTMEVNRAVAIEANARIRAQEVSGIINLLRSSPDGTSFEYSLPKIECSIVFEGNYVDVNMNLENSESEYKINLIQDINIEGLQKLECSNDMVKKYIFGKNKGNNIEIKIK